MALFAVNIRSIQSVRKVYELSPNAENGTF